MKESNSQTHLTILQKDLPSMHGNREFSMKTSFYVADAITNARIPANFRPANQFDFNVTDIDNWQSSWNSDFIHQEGSEKYAFEVSDSREVLGLGAYKDTPEGFMVTVLYIESAPHSNPTLTREKKYNGIGAALLAYGIQMSREYGYGGTIFLKAKTSQLWTHYVNDFGAIPYSRVDPFALMIDADAADQLLARYLEEE